MTLGFTEGHTVAHASDSDLGLEVFGKRFWREERVIVFGRETPVTRWVQGLTLLPHYAHGSRI